MRENLRRGRALGAALLALVAGGTIFAGVAQGDWVTNTLDNTIDGTPETMALTVGGGAGATSLVVKNQNAGAGDTNNPCNLAGSGTSLTVSLASSDPAVATVSPASLTFDDCDVLKGVTVTPVSAGSATITATQTAYSGTGLMDTAPATFTVNVTGAPVDTTPPDIGYTLDPASPNGENGWYTSDVSIDWTVSDPQSAITSTTNCDDKTVSSDAMHSETCEATSAGGTSSETASFNIDKTNPTVSVTGVSNGATYTLGSVPAAGCETSDDTSGVQADASLSTTGGPVGSVTATCSGAKDEAGNPGSASVTYSVIYDWHGFFRPVDNPDVLNVAKAGSSIPVKFSLSGDQGLNILGAGYPASKRVDCAQVNDAGADAIESTANPGSATLSYDPVADQYNYVWKTDKGWAGTCRQLQVQLIDGTRHVANFKLTK